MTWLLCAALLATPLTADEVRQRVNDYLGAIDRPVSDAQWKALGPHAGPVLESIASDANSFPSKRAKALEGLAASAPDRAARLVGPMARDEKQPVVVRVAAMRGAGHVLSPDAAERELKPVLTSARSAGMRRSAADVLSRNKGGCGAVRQQAARERADHRSAWKAVLDRCAE